MHKELRRCNSIGNQFGIYKFAQIAFYPDQTDFQSAYTLCAFQENIRLNFNCAVLAFEFLGLIEHRGGLLLSNKEYEYFKGSTSIEGFSKDLCIHCFSVLLEKGLVDFDAIKYNEIVDQFYIQRNAFPLQIAIFRNLLIDLGALVEDQYNNFIILPALEDVILSKIRAAKKTTQEQLLLQLENQREQGRLAEEFVLRYERNRLSMHPMGKDIRLVSDIDVSAGFDIVSLRDSSSKLLDIFIEVKSYKGNLHFYWSENEIQQAKLKEGHYYIYLVDIEKIGDPSYIPRIIRNPAQNILTNPGWLLSPTSFRIIEV